MTGSETRAEGLYKDEACSLHATGERKMRLGMARKGGSGQHKDEWRGDQRIGSDGHLLPFRRHATFLLTSQLRLSWISFKHLEKNADFCVTVQ